MKKSQVTIFVILGIVVLMIGAIFLYLYSQNSTPPVRSEATGDLKVVQQYFEQCLNQVGTEAIVKIGQHGGYIDPYDPYLSGRLFIKNPVKQYESDLAYLSDDPDSAVAYWYYGFSASNICENCVRMSQAPYVSEMERQLSIYVSEHLDGCLNNFSSFQDKGYTLDHPDYALIQTTLTQNNVVFQANYPVNLTKDGTVTSMSEYNAQVDIPLLKYYNMAINISLNAYENSFLENMDQYLISSFSGLDGNKLPPTYAQTTGYDLKFWTQTGVKNMFKDTISTYLPMMQIVGTKNYRPITSKGMSLYEQNLYKSMSLDIFNGQSNPNTEINFLYLGQDMYFRVDPSKDELIGPKEYVYDTKSMLPASRVNDYNFFYTFSYPVIVEINDKYNGKDNYQFIFALQSNMVNNLNLQDYWNNDQNQIYWDPSYLKLNVNDPLVGASIPGISGGKPVNYTYKSRPTKNIFCEDTQKQSGEIKVKTYDAMTNKPLSDVVLTYGCGNYVSCNIGRTALNVTLGYSTYSAQLPICMNGYLTLEKPNYQKQSIPLTTVAGIDDDLGSIYLEPIVTKNVSIMKNIMERHYKQEKKVTVLGVIKSVYTEGILDPTSTNAVFIGNYLAANNTKLGLNDTVILTLTKINTSALEASYSQTIVFGQDATSNTTTLNLVPGSYTIKAQLIDYLGVLIHKQCKTICVDKNALQTVFGGCKTTKIPQDDLSIVPAVWGGVEFTAQDPFIVTSNDLKGNKTLEFYVVRLPDPRCIDDLSEPSTVPLITQNNRIKLIPKWK